MSEDTIIELQTPGSSPQDLLTETIRTGARQLLAAAIEAEVEELLQQHSDIYLDDGRLAVVRNGYLPGRHVQTGVGAVSVQVPKVRDRSDSGVKFNSNIIPPYLRRSKSLDELIPWLYLRGVSTGNMQCALEALTGKDAKGFSAGVVSRLKKQWKEDHEQWRKRDLSKKRYVYLWADGIYFNIRMDNADLCILVIIGVTDSGKKEFVAIEDGYRESTQSWLEVLRDLKRRGLTISPELAIGDGSLGFWKALPQVYGNCRTQRCWVHKTANVLNKLPKSVQPKAKSHLQDIWMAPGRDEANRAFDFFLDTYEAKYPKAVTCLVKDRNTLLTFYDFPAEHWVHIRTTNPIESSFATTRLRTDRTRGCVSRDSILSMVFKLSGPIEKGWRRIRGFKRLAEVIEGINFVDGLRVNTQPSENQISRMAA
jgi:transposase-like protein